MVMASTTLPVGRTDGKITKVEDGRT